MLKLTYTETGFYLEQIDLALEDWIGQRSVLAVRLAKRLCIEPSAASFLLPIDALNLRQLELVIQEESEKGRDWSISLSICDAEYIEVSLEGCWLSASVETDEGVFVTTLSDRTESILFELWQNAQACTSSLSY